MIKYPIERMYAAGYRHTDGNQIMIDFNLDSVQACKVCFLLAEYEETLRICNELLPNV